MGEEISDTMNLDLNLGPGPEAEPQPISNEAVNLDEWINDPSELVWGAAARFRPRQRWTRQQLLPIELNQLIGSSENGTSLETGEGSTAAEERVDGGSKTCENGNGIVETYVSDKKDDVEKSSGNDGSFFDCNICLDMSKEPVVTCCGHLFCWPCLYQWLHYHSDAKECPVCKGEVTSKTLTPIYGRGSIQSGPEEGLDVKIPMRPHARRLESLRQTLQRTSFSSPMEEMIRQIRGRFDREPTSVPELSNSETPERHDRANLLLNRFLTSRALRGEQNPVSVPDEIDLTQNVSADLETEAPRFQSLLVRRHLLSHRAARVSSLSSALNSAERLVDAYFRSHPMGRNQDQNLPVNLPVDDRDSFSSIAAVINSESQENTAVEIDSMVTLSTSSSRRRNESASRVSDVDSEDSRAYRRRRLG